MGTNVTTRKLRIAGKMLSDEANSFDVRISDNLNYLHAKFNNNATGMSDSEMYFYIFNRGMMAIEQERTSETGKEGIHSKIAKMLEKRRIEDVQKKAFEQAYRELGLDDFVGWCTENNYDWEAIITEINSAPKKPPTKSQLYTTFLTRVLSEGELPVDQIKKAAVDLGEVTDDKDWNLMKVVACREGFTSTAYGYWKNP